MLAIIHNFGKIIISTRKYDFGNIIDLVQALKKLQLDSQPPKCYFDSKLKTPFRKGRHLFDLPIYNLL